MKMTVNTIRVFDNDQAREYAFGDSNSLRDKLALGFINPADFKKLNLQLGLNLRLTNDFGSVIIKPKEEKDVPEGLIILPVSIWANQITGIENNEPVYKNVGVNVEVTKDSVLEINEILSTLKQ